MGSLFSMQGRYNRAKYFATIFVVTLIVYAVAFVLGMAIGAPNGDTSAATGIGYLVGIPGMIINAFAAVKRFHDLDRPGTHYWLLLIPFYNIYLGLVLLFEKGTVGDNKYGPDPLGGTRPSPPVG